MLLLESFYSRELAKLPVQNPVLTSLVIKKYAKMGAEDYYAKSKSVVTYPEYLFRMDAEQKWTKPETENNICVLPNSITQPNVSPIECINNYFVYSFYDKEILYHSLLDWQKKQFSNPLEKTEKYLNHAKERIRFFDMTYESEEEGKNTDMVADIVTTLNLMAVSVINIAPICAVSHLDEDYPHVHFLYMLDPSMTLSKKDLNKIPHINVLFGLQKDDE